MGFARVRSLRAPLAGCASADRVGLLAVLLDIFSELQKPGPFAPDHEARVLADAIEQAQLADRLGFGC